MSVAERQNFLSSEEGKLFKEKYEETGYRYQEKDVEAFCEDIKDGSLLESDETDSSRRPRRRSRRRSYSGGGSSSRSSPRPCPENGEFPSEGSKLSYIRFDDTGGKYTEYTHKKYRQSTTGRNPSEKGEAEDENGDAHGQDVLLHSFFISHNNILALFLDRELIEYESRKTYYLYLSEVGAENGEGESRRMELKPGKDYTIYYWSPACANDSANDEKCECQNPDEPNCLPGKPEDPDWNRGVVTSIQGLSSIIVDALTPVTVQVLATEEIPSESISDYFQDEKQIVHIASEKSGDCEYYQHEEEL